LLETDLRSIANLSTIDPADEPFVSDFAAARLWAVDNLNKPSPQSTPEDRLRHGFIKRLEEEVRQAIACIAENDFAEEILNGPIVDSEPTHSS